MSIRIVLDNAPEFYTNLDIVRGRVILGISRHENVAAITVKLEGESKTALAVPDDFPGPGQGNRASSGDVVHENHKILYKVAQVFPDDNTAGYAPFMLAPGQHAYPFRFKIPFNNCCSDPEMASVGAISGPGSLGGVEGLLGLGKLRTMAVSRQLLYSHVTKTLPPSFTGFPRQAEIRYYIKVTVQRPGLFKENWRYHVGFKFLPIEPPRSATSAQEAYARRPFTFRTRESQSRPSLQGSGSLFQGSRRSSNNVTPNNASPSPISPMGEGGKGQPPSPSPSSSAAPSIEMSARLPHPSILTCNKPIPLRLIAKKLSPASAEIFLVSMQIDLIGTTHVRCDDLANKETSRWVVMSRHGLSISVSQPSDAIGNEFVVPDTLWRSIALPNTVMPSFATCNLKRTYELEVKLGLSHGPPSSNSGGVSSLFKSKARSADLSQAIHLPLHFSDVEVYSGLAPPPALVEAMRKQKQQGGRRRPQTQPYGHQRPQQQRPQQQRPQQQQQSRPPIPPRPTTQQPPVVIPVHLHDPLYPPQLAPGQDAAALDDAPPSYDEAMAESMAGPAVPDGTSRPAYSGVTNENGPSTIPEKGD